MDDDLFGAGGWRWREALLIAGVVFIIWAIFANEAYHGDEVAYVLAAQGFIDVGFKPLGAALPWGTNMGPETTAVPPLARAWFGLSALAFGMDEISLRFASFVAALLVALGTYGLAAGMTREPLATTLLAIATPAFVLYHNALNGALPALACTLWALVLQNRAGIRFNTFPYGRLTHADGVVGPGDWRMHVQHFRYPLPFVFAPDTAQRIDIWLRYPEAVAVPLAP